MSPPGRRQRIAKEAWGVVPTRLPGAPSNRHDHTGGAAKVTIASRRRHDGFATRIQAAGSGYDLSVSTPRGIRASGGVRRLGWGLADQALSSMTNFALAILVARSVSTSALGAFGLAFTTYTITLGATRALCQEPLTVCYSATGEPE